MSDNYNWDDILDRTEDVKPAVTNLDVPKAIVAAAQDSFDRKVMKSYHAPNKAQADAFIAFMKAAGNFTTPLTSAYVKADEKDPTLVKYRAGNRRGHHASKK